MKTTTGCETQQQGVKGKNRMRKATTAVCKIHHACYLYHSIKLWDIVCEKRDICQWESLKKYHFVWQYAPKNLTKDWPSNYKAWCEKNQWIIHHKFYTFAQGSLKSESIYACASCIVTIPLTILLTSTIVNITRMRNCNRNMILLHFHWINT